MLGLTVKGVDLAKYEMKGDRERWGGGGLEIENKSMEEKALQPFYHNT